MSTDVKPTDEKNEEVSEVENFEDGTNEEISNPDLIQDFSSAARGDNITDARMNLSDIFISASDNIRDQNQGYDPKKLAELVESIRSVGGLLQPISVTQVDPVPANEEKSYSLVFGFRRAMALQALAKEDPAWAQDVPVRIIAPNSEVGTIAIQLMENVSRSDLNPMDICNAIVSGLEEDNVNQADFASLLGMPVSTVANYKKLNELTPAAKEALRKGDLGVAAAKILVYKIYPNVEEKRRDDQLKVAINKPYDELVKVAQRYEPSNASEAADTTSGSDGSGSPSGRFVTPKTAGVFIEFLDKALGKAKDGKDADKKEFTKAQLIDSRIDTIKCLLQNGGTDLDDAVAPYLKEIEEKEEKEKATKKSSKDREKWMKGLLKNVKEMFTLVPEDPDAERPSLTKCIATVASATVESCKKEEVKNELTFDPPEDGEEFVKELAKAWQDKVKEEKAKAEANAKKAAEKAAKEKADKEAAEKGKAATTS